MIYDANTQQITRVNMKWKSVKLAAFIVASIVPTTGCVYYGPIDHHNDWYDHANTGHQPYVQYDAIHDITINRHCCYNQYSANAAIVGYHNKIRQVNNSFRR